MTNPKAGHTSASGMTNNSQGLRDGDGLTSPSLTNLYEGLHGNGILRLGDGAKGDSLRNSIIANTPGFIETTATQGELKVYGGYCVLDGVLYKFANGPGSHETFVIGTTGGGANHSGDLPSVPADNSDVFVVVYLVGRNTPEAHLMYEMGTPAAPSTGTPLIPNRFLSNPSITSNTDLNHQTSVLAVLRYSMTGGAGSVTSSLSTSPTINDRRAFIRQSPVYLTPMTKGSIGNVDAANIVTSPDGFFPSPENGDLAGSTFGAIWQSHRDDVAGNQHAAIYAAIPRNLNTTPVTNTHILGPDRLEVITTSGNVTFEFNEGNVWVVTTDNNRTINPTGTFPIGHIVEIYHASGAHNLHFDSTSGGHSASPTNVNIPLGSFGRFIYDGTNWKQLLVSSTSASAYTDAQAIAAVEGESTLVLQSGVTVGTDLKLSTSSDDVIIENVTQDKDIIFKANDGGASTEIMRIDADVARVGIGLNNPSGKLHVKTTDVNYAALFETTDDSASAAPDVALYRNSATPANGDDLGHLIWRGVETDGALSPTLTRGNYADIFCEAQVVTTGSESGKMHLRTKVAGTMKKRISIAATETIINEDAQNTDLRIESTGNQNMIRVDASDDKVGIGHAPTTIDATLDILTGGTFRNTRLLTVSVSASTTLTEADHAGRYNICAGNITLPSTSTAGEYYTILNTTGGNITIGRNGNNINGAGADYTLATFKIATCIAIGSNNWIVSD